MMMIIIVVIKIIFILPIFFNLSSLGVGIFIGSSLNIGIINIIIIIWIPVIMFDMVCSYKNQ